MCSNHPGDTARHAGAVDGVGDTDTARIIPNVFRAMTGQLPHVTLNGDGSAVRDFVHVADVASAVRSALTRCVPGRHGTYNVGSGTGSSMAEVVAVAQRITGRAVTIKQMPPKPEPPSLTADISRTAEALDWRPIRSDLPRIVADAWEAWHR